MPRIRTVKPELWSSPGMAGLDLDARLLFIALWNWADDCGRGTANPRELAGFAFPHDEHVESADIRRMLGGIRRAFDVRFYKVGGRPYFEIPSWDRHQKIDKRSQGRHPSYEEGEDWNPDPTKGPDQEKQSDSEVPAESSPSPRRDLGAGTGEQGNRGTGEEDKSATTSPSEPEQTRDDVEQICERLRAGVVSNGSKDPGISAKWRTEARLLIDRDGRDLQEVLFLIDWCQHNDFWRSNILSMPKFRQKYDTLRMQSQRQPQLRAVSGGYQPWTNPTDPSAYEGDL